MSQNSLALPTGAKKKKSTSNKENGCATARSPNWTEEETDVLLSLIEDNIVFLESSFRGSGAGVKDVTNNRKQAIYESISTEVSAVHNIERSWKECRKKAQNMHNRAKQALKEAASQVGLSGRGNNKAVMELVREASDPATERWAKLVSETLVTGIKGGAASSTADQERAKRGLQENTVSSDDETEQQPPKRPSIRVSGISKSRTAPHHPPSSSVNANLEASGRRDDPVYDPCLDTTDGFGSSTGRIVSTAIKTLTYPLADENDLDLIDMETTGAVMEQPTTAAMTSTPSSSNFEKNDQLAPRILDLSCTSSGTTSSKGIKRTSSSTTDVMDCTPPSIRKTTLKTTSTHVKEKKTDDSALAQVRLQTLAIERQTDAIQELANVQMLAVKTNNRTLDTLTKILSSLYEKSPSAINDMSTIQQDKWIPDTSEFE